MILHEGDLILVHFHAKTAEFRFQLSHVTFDVPHATIEFVHTPLHLLHTSIKSIHTSIKSIHPTSQILTNLPSHITNFVENDGHRLADAHIIVHMASIRAIAIVAILILLHGKRRVSEQAGSLQLPRRSYTFRDATDL